MKHNKRITRKQIKLIYEILYSFVRKVKYDHVSSFAAHAALFLLMSLFPMAMYCIAVFSYLPIDTAHHQSNRCKKNHNIGNSKCIEQWHPSCLSDSVHSIHTNNHCIHSLGCTKQHCDHSDECSKPKIQDSL